MWAHLAVTKAVEPPPFVVESVVKTTIVATNSPALQESAYNLVRTQEHQKVKFSVPRASKKRLFLLPVDDETENVLPAPVGVDRVVVASKQETEMTIPAAKEFPVCGMAEHNFPIGAGLGEVPVISMTQMYLRTRRSDNKSSFFVHNQLFLPCIEVVETVEGAAEVIDSCDAVRSRVIRCAKSKALGTSDPRKDGVVNEVRLDGWVVTTSSALGGDDGDNNLLRDTAVCGASPLLLLDTSSRDTNFFLLFGDSQTYDLVVINSEGEEKRVLQALQCFGTEALCSTYSNAVVASISERRRGKFYLLDLIVPASSDVRLAFCANSSSIVDLSGFSACIWKHSDEKLI